MASVKFQGNRFKIDGEIAENHAILVDHFFNLTASIMRPVSEYIDWPNRLYAANTRH